MTKRIAPRFIPTCIPLTELISIANLLEPWTLRDRTPGHSSRVPSPQRRKCDRRIQYRKMIAWAGDGVTDFGGDCGGIWGCGPSSAGVGWRGTKGGTVNRSEWFFGLILTMVCLAALCCAARADLHFQAGARTGGSSPPEVIDMRWARPYLDMNATGAPEAAPKE